jgi:hypothetical protein
MARSTIPCEVVPIPVAEGTTSCCPGKGVRRWMTRESCEVSDKQPVVVLSDNGADDLSLFIRRRGKDAWLFEYPVWDREDGRAVFRLDSQFLTAKAGRYEAELRSGCAVCHTFELVLSAPCDTRPTIVCPEAADRLVLHTEKPEGLTVVVFESIQNFCATFCDTLEKDEDVLPLSAEDKDFLCEQVLCKPVELVVSDGYKTETVLFSGCEAGEPVVERCRAGTQLRRFPRGAKVCFSWTAYNVTAECEGC